MSNRKILLLYVGPGYTGSNSFQAADIQNVINTGATEFLLLTAKEFNFPKANDKVLWPAWVQNTNNIPDSVFGTTNATHISTIRAGMLTAISNHDQNYSSLTHNYAKYIEASVNLAKLLHAENSSCKLWFGIPMILGNCQPAAKCYNYYYKTYFYDVLKEKLQEESLWGNVEGIYYGTEDAVAWYTKFNTGSVSTQFNNVVVQNMKYMSDIVHADNKKFLWIPYYLNSSELETITRLGYIANKTNIFDIVILQPGYYQHASKVVQGNTIDMSYHLNAIDKSVSTQQVRTTPASKTGTGTIVGSSKTSSTEIGVEMEIDAKIMDGRYENGNLVEEATAFQNRYNGYVTQYGKYITGSTKRPIAFYAGGPADFKRDGVYSRVKKFFTSGTNI